MTGQADTPPHAAGDEERNPRLAAQEVCILNVQDRQRLQQRRKKPNLAVVGEFSGQEKHRCHGHRIDQSAHQPADDGDVVAGIKSKPVADWFSGWFVACNINANAVDHPDCPRHGVGHEYTRGGLRRPQRKGAVHIVRLVDPGVQRGLLWVKNLAPPPLVGVLDVGSDIAPKTFIGL